MVTSGKNQNLLYTRYILYKAPGFNTEQTQSLGVRMGGGAGGGVGGIGLGSTEVPAFAFSFMHEWWPYITLNPFTRGKGLPFFLFSPPSNLVSTTTEFIDRPLQWDSLWYDPLLRSSTEGSSGQTNSGDATCSHNVTEHFPQKKESKMITAIRGVLHKCFSLEQKLYLIKFINPGQHL